jgi:hypothetical protein
MRAKHCTLVNPLCPDDLCQLEYGHEGADRGEHALSTMIDCSAVSDLMFMAPAGTTKPHLMRLGYDRAMELWPEVDA